MAKRRDSAYIYFAFVIVFLLLNLLVLNISAKLQLLPIFIIIFLLSFIFFKFRKDKTYARIQVTITMLLIGIVQIVLYLLTGFLEGFSKNAISMSFNRFLTVSTRFCPRKIDYKPCKLALLAFGADTSAVVFDYFFCNGKSETRSSHFA